MSTSPQIPNETASIPPDRYLSPSTAARLFDLREATVRAWCRRGELDHIRLGKLIRIPLSALLAKAERA